MNTRRSSSSSRNDGSEFGTLERSYSDSSVTLSTVTLEKLSNILKDFIDHSNIIVTSVTITVEVASTPDPNNEKLKTVTKNDQK